ncbi:hypothetical protein, partial [Amycolatopsis sp.]|uniref:hypothetical protein n=1 Tax=Amycolatopsis sp. TaxID=37632 RepID=UPI003BB95941
LSGHAPPVRRLQAPSQAGADRSTEKHHGRLSHGSDHSPGRHLIILTVVADLDELVTEAVSVVEVASGTVQKGCDNVPGNAAVGEMVKRGQLAGEGVRRFWEILTE